MIKGTKYFKKSIQLTKDMSRTIDFLLISFCLINIFVFVFLPSTNSDIKMFTYFEFIASLLIVFSLILSSIMYKVLIYKLKKESQKLELKKGG